MWKHTEVIFPPSWHSFAVIFVFTSTWYVHSNLIRYESIDMFACPHVPGHLSLVTCPCHMPPGGQAPAPVLAWWQCRGCKKYKCQGGCGWPGPASVLGDPKPPLPGTLLSRMEPPAVCGGWGPGTGYGWWWCTGTAHCTGHATTQPPALAITPTHSCHFRQKRTTDLKGQIRAYFSWKIRLFSWKLLKLFQLEFSDFFWTKRIP